MSKKQKRHLFFINGPVPTEEQQAAADELNGLVCFRNRFFVRDDEPHAVETFDELHGDIPPVYLRARAAKEGRAADNAAPVAEAPPAGAKVAVAPPEPLKTGMGGAWKPNA